MSDYLPFGRLPWELRESIFAKVPCSEAMSLLRVNKESRGFVLERGLFSRPISKIFVRFMPSRCQARFFHDDNSPCRLSVHGAQLVAYKPLLRQIKTVGSMNINFYGIGGEEAPFSDLLACLHPRPLKELTILVNEEKLYSAHSLVVPRDRRDEVIDHLRSMIEGLPSFRIGLGFGFFSNLLAPLNLKRIEMTFEFRDQLVYMRQILRAGIPSAHASAEIEMVHLGLAPVLPYIDHLFRGVQIGELPIEHRLYRVDRPDLANWAVPCLVRSGLPFFEEQSWQVFEMSSGPGLLVCIGLFEYTAQLPGRSISCGLYFRAIRQ